MKATARSIVLSLSGLGLLAYFVFSAITAGSAATTTVIALSGLVGWGMIQMIMLDLSFGADESAASSRATVRVPARVHRLGVPALVEYATRTSGRRAA